MPINLNFEKPGKISYGYLVKELIDLKFQICELLNQVQNDLENSESVPSPETVTLANIMFGNFTFSDILAVSVESQTLIYKRPIDSTTNVTAYGISPTDCKLINNITYALEVLVGTNNLSLTQLLSSSPTNQIYNENDPTVVESLVKLQSHFTSITELFRNKCDSIPTLLDDNRDVCFDIRGNRDDPPNPPTNCQFLTFRDCKWTNDFVTINSGIIKDSCVGAINPLTDGDFLVWNALGGCWTNAGSGGGIGASTDIQQATKALSDPVVTETLPAPTMGNINWNSIGSGIFQLTTNIPGGFNDSGYLLTWTSVIEFGNGNGSVRFRITATGLPAAAVTSLETNTATQLDFNRREQKLVSINYVVPDVPTGTVFDIEWGMASNPARQVTLNSGTFVLFSVAFTPP